MKNKIEESFNTEIQQQIDDLRLKYNELYDKSSAVQKQIDELFIKALNYDKYINKYIRYYDKQNDVYYYMYVTDVKRKYDGVLFIGAKFTCAVDDSNEQQDMYFRGMTNVESVIPYMYMHYISIIDKDEFNTVINDANKFFMKSIDEIANKS